MQSEHHIEKDKKDENPTLYRWAFELYKDFSILYIITILLGLIFAAIIGITMIFLFGVPKNVNIEDPLFGTNNTMISLQNLASLFPSFIILTSTVESLFGISREIYEKGDYSSSLNLVFVNFKKNWLFFTFSGIIFFVGFNLIDLFVSSINPFDVELLSISISFLITNTMKFFWIIVNCIYISCYLRKNDLKDGFNQFFSIFKVNFTNIFKNFIQILGPLYLFSYLFIYVFGYYVNSWIGQLIYFLGIITFLILCVFILFPIISIVSQITVSQYYSIQDISFQEKESKNRSQINRSE